MIDSLLQVRISSRNWLEILFRVVKPSKEVYWKQYYVDRFTNGNRYVIGFGLFIVMLSVTIFKSKNKTL